MRILVIAEHDHRHLGAATRHAISAAARIGGDVDVLVAGHECSPVASEAAALHGVARVLLADAGQYAAQTAENLAPLVTANAVAYSHLLAPASAFGKNLMPRVAALLDVAAISDVCAVVTADTFRRAIYAGNALATIQCRESLKILTIRTSAFEPVSEGGDAVIETIAATPDMALSEILGREMADAGPTGRPELGTARIVVAGGRGLGSAERFEKILTPLADRLGAAIGASYGAVSAGYAANDLQVGQTGKIVAPDLYIAVGISGAIQHLAGMKDSKVIVAINKDPEAPIFKIADYGLVADLFDAVPELVRVLG